jgi:Rod binding domain-containing protein
MMDLSSISENILLEGNVKKSNSKGPDHTNTASDYKRVAKEMESLFAYQLIKIMRETVNDMSEEKKGIGQDTYSSLFDMEVSRLLSERGLGLQDNIVKWLERMPESIESNPDSSR